MKKILTIAIAVMMIAVMSVSVFAADTGKIYAVDADYAGLGNMDAQFKGNEDDATKGCLGLGPVSPETSADAYIKFTVEVDTAGTYTLTLRYDCKAKDGQTRCADMIVNDGERIHLAIEQLPDWNTYATLDVEVHLNAGANTVTLVNVEGFDNSTYKAINVDYLAWALKTADVVETPDEPTETPDEPTETPDEPTETPDEPTETPSEDENAPQTGVAAAILSVVAVLSGAYIVSKKH